MSRTSRLDVLSTGLLTEARNRRHWLGQVLGMGTGLWLSGCESPTSSEPPPAPTTGHRWKIVCTIGMVTDLVQQIVGELGEVLGLLSEGVDPHLYRPTARDTGLMMQADLVFYSGLHLEGRMTEDFEAAEKHGRRFYAVTADLPEDQLITSDVAGVHDPHVWGDVRLWIQCARTIARRLLAFDPSHAATYQANSDRLCTELEKLDLYIRQVIASIPEPQRLLVTAHDAFAYFSRAYSIPVKSVQGISTESEAGVNDINALVDLLVDKKIPTVFVEASVNPKSLEAVREGTAQRGWPVSVGGTLYSDSMGALGTYEGTYAGMMDANATTIARSLGGNAPVEGWRGQLPSAKTTQP